jgi:purine-binding chemotaxis protein CheW
MSVHEEEAETHATALERAFDRSFAEAPPSERPLQHDLLAIGVGGDPYAIRLHEVAGLLSEKPITWLPGAPTELLGVMSLRGAIIPVYDSRALLGYAQAAVPRWLVMAAAVRVAIAFDRFEGHLRVAPESISPGGQRGRDPQWPHVREVVRAGSLARPIIHLASILDRIAVLVPPRPGRKDSDR